MKSLRIFKKERFTTSSKNWNRRYFFTELVLTQ